MSDPTQATESAEASTANTATANSEDTHEQNDDHDHDCKDYLEYVEYEWVGDTYDDILVCDICESEYRVVFERAFLLDGEDYSLVEEYTDSIERKLRRLRNNQDDDTDGDEEDAASVES